ncbi:MAG: hypothetical protein AAF596_03910, partial [Planctomycetota bacterium]
QLRRAAGVLHVDDRSVVHAVRVPTAARGTWRFRVWLPGDEDQYLSDWSLCVDEVVPAEPLQPSDEPLPPGEHLVDVVAICRELAEVDERSRAEALNEVIEITVIVDGIRITTHEVLWDNPLFPADILDEYHWLAVGLEQISSDATGPLVLLALPSGQQYSPDESTLIWLSTASHGVAGSPLPRREEAEELLECFKRQFFQ